MAKLEDLVAAASALSTASDGLSVKVDTLIDKAGTVIEALRNADLPPNAVAALTAMEASVNTVVEAGDNVDAEVARLDTVLPTPAPAGA